eukprot:gene26453-31018_t
MMATDIGRSNMLVNFLIRWVLAPFTKSMSQGAATTLTCALLPQDQLRGHERRARLTALVPCNAPNP